MLKLTRLNNQIVVVNPDHIYAAESLPDTTLKLVGGERILVLETLDELIDKVVEFRRHVNDARGVATVTLRQQADAALRAKEEEEG